MPEVTKDEDRSGGRHADKFWFVFREVGETWESTRYRNATRKVYLNNGAGSLQFYLGGLWHDIPPSYTHDYKIGDVLKLRVISLGPDGTAVCYLHVEWEV